MSTPSDMAALLDRRQYLKLMGAGAFSMTQNAGAKMRDARSAVDHLLLGSSDRESGIAWIENRTGVKAIIGGSHPGRGTCNALISLGTRQYLEIIAPDPSQETLDPQYSFLRDLKTPSLITWAASVDNATSAVEAFRAAGAKVVGPFPGSRRRPDGKMMSWKSVGITSELGSIVPFFIEWEEGVIHPSIDSPQGCKLLSLELSHPQPKEVSEMFARLGITANVKRATDFRMKAVFSSPKGKIELT